MYIYTDGSLVRNKPVAEVIIPHTSLYGKPPSALVPIFKEPQMNRAYIKMKSLGVILRREEYRWKQLSDRSCHTD